MASSDCFSPQACSQTATSRANTALHNLKEEDGVEEEVHTILCSALTRISTHCLRKLSRCFTPRDVGKMVERQVDEMESYLARLAGHRLGSERLDKCDLGVRRKQGYGEDGTHHFVFYDVADKEVGTHSFTFEQMEESVSNGTMIEVIDLREGGDGRLGGPRRGEYGRRGGHGRHGGHGGRSKLAEYDEELQDKLWGESEVEKGVKFTFKKNTFIDEQKYQLLPLVTSRSQSLVACVNLIFLKIACHIRWL